MNKIKTLIKRQKTKPRKSFEAGECDNMKFTKGPRGSRAGRCTSRREDRTGRLWRGRQKAGRGRTWWTAPSALEVLHVSQAEGLWGPRAVFPSTFAHFGLCFPFWHLSHPNLFLTTILAAVSAASGLCCHGCDLLKAQWCRFSSRHTHTFRHDAAAHLTEPRCALGEQKVCACFARRCLSGAAGAQLPPLQAGPINRLAESSGSPTRRDSDTYGHTL